ncbi:hypothetical protein LSAT2_001835 [Lamellibrachia satsuma]|nr:hypothetical protein LSAT2_001835 [Lamellibrachia satsuma]
MSLRQAFRSKIKDVLHGGDHHGYHPIASDQDGAQNEAETTSIKSTQSLSVELPEMEGMSDGPSPSPSSEMDVYESQLNQLQEHLVAAMLENQQLNRELKSCKDSQEVTRLLGELERVRERNKQLEDELSQTTTSNQLTVGDGRRRHEELVKNEDAPHVVSSRRGWTERVVDWTTRIFYDLISDFTDDPDPVVNRNTHDLTVKKLKESIMRFKSATNPIFETASNVSAMFIWKNPAFSFLAFLTYMYLVWTGYLLPVLLFLAIVRLGANNLKERGWNLNVAYLPSASTEAPGKHVFTTTEVAKMSWKRSEEVGRFRYTGLVGDGDAAVMDALSTISPYPESDLNTDDSGTDKDDNGLCASRQ